MKELENAVVASFNTMVESGKLNEVIQNKIEATVASIINDLFQNWSDFGKQLKEHIKDQLEINFSDLQITGYNKIIVDQIQHVFDSQIKCVGKEHLEKQIKAMLGDPIKEIKLSEIIEKFIEEIIDDDEHQYGEISFHYSNKYNSLAHIYFDKEPNKAIYQCVHTVRVNINDQTMHSFELEGYDTGKDTTQAGRLYGFDKLLFQLYTAGSKVILDHDDVETSYGDY